MAAKPWEIPLHDVARGRAVMTMDIYQNNNVGNVGNVVTRFKSLASHAACMAHMLTCNTIVLYKYFL